MYSEEELQRGLNTQVFGRKLFVYDSIDSTNAYAKTLAEKGAEEGTVVIADHQTAGRGRFGRTWLCRTRQQFIVLRHNPAEIQYGQDWITSLLCRRWYCPCC